VGLSATSKPSWLKTILPGRGEFRKVKGLLRRYRLNTVCEAARCPNLGRCWAKGTATVMILGSICTRSCGFCAVKTGRPEPVDPEEPERIATAASKLGLSYLVITSVDRDDLADLGASQFARVVELVRKQGVEVEVLVPDFDAKEELIKRVVDEGPQVFAHNLETVARLTPEVRDPRHSYDRSLEVLRIARRLKPGLITKTGLMVGLGEDEEEVIRAMRDARSAGVDIFTIGQYLQPTRNHLPVQAYIPPHTFSRYQRIGTELGLKVVSGPLVRSSYKAAEIYHQLRRDYGSGSV